jgi:large subunit ribosomal protein L25
VPEVRIDAETRTEFGKGPARRVRRAGKVPAVLYGHGTEPRHLTLPGHDVLLALRTPNVLIRLEGLDGGRGQLALPKAVQRDAIKGFVEHVDLILVRRGEKVTVEIPVTVAGAVVPDAMLDQQMVQIAVEAEATNIPPGIEVNIESLQIGEAVHARDLALPAGATLAVDPDLLVLHVIAAPTAEQIAAELGEVTEAEGEEAPESEPAPVPEAPAEPAG